MSLEREFGPDPLAPYYVRHGEPPTGPAAVVRVLVLMAAGGSLGWMSASAWTGDAPAPFGFLVFWWLTAQAVPTLTHRMSYVILRAQLYRTIACASIRYVQMAAAPYEPAQAGQRIED